MKKIFSFFVIFFVFVFFSVSVFALPMPDLIGCPNIEYDSGNLIFNNVKFSSLEEAELQPILDCFVNHNVNNANNSGFFAFNSGVDYGNPKSVLFEFYSFYTGGPPNRPVCYLKLSGSSGHLYVFSSTNGVFPHYKWSFLVDGTVRYDGYRVQQTITVDYILISETPIFNQTSSVFENSDEFFIGADFNKFIIKDDLNNNLSFNPVLYGSVKPEPPKEDDPEVPPVEEKPPEPPKPVEPPKIPQQSSDYVPFDTSCLLDFFTSVKTTSYSIVISGIGLFGLFLGFSIIPRTIRKFTKG